MENLLAILKGWTDTNTELNRVNIIPKIEHSFLFAPTLDCGAVASSTASIQAIFILLAKTINVYNITKLLSRPHGKPARGKEMISLIYIHIYFNLVGYCM